MKCLSDTLPMSLVQNTLKYREEFSWFQDALSQDFSEHNASSEKKGWCLHHAIALFAPWFRKLVTDPDPVCGTILTRHPVVKSNSTHVHLLAYGPNIRELSWFILLADGQNIRTILTSNSEFNYLCYSSTITWGGEYSGVRHRSLWVNTGGVCERMVICLNFLVLIVGDCCRSRRRRFAPEDTAGVSRLFFFPVVEDSKA